MSNSDRAEILPKSTPVPLDTCGMALAAQLLMEKWTMLIVREAFYGIARFEDFQRDLQIPRSVLTARLKRLVEIDVLTIVPYRSEGARKRNGYVLTAKGSELAFTILALMQWGDKHLNGGQSAITVKDRRTQQEIAIGLVPLDCETVPLSQVQVDIPDPKDSAQP